MGMGVVGHGNGEEKQDEQDGNGSGFFGAPEGFMPVHAPGVDDSNGHANDNSEEHRARVVQKQRSCSPKSARCTNADVSNARWLLSNIKWAPLTERAMVEFCRINRAPPRARRAEDRRQAS
jgi:hypothetical protein